MKRSKNVKIIFIWSIALSILFYLISLNQTAFIYIDDCWRPMVGDISRHVDVTKTASGFYALGWGGGSIIFGGAIQWIIWLANPLYIISIILFLAKRKTSKVFITISLLLAALFSVQTDIRNPFDCVIISIEKGYWLWLSSIAILAIGIHLYFRLMNNNQLQNDLNIENKLVENTTDNPSNTI